MTTRKENVVVSQRTKEVDVANLYLVHWHSIGASQWGPEWIDRWKAFTCKEDAEAFVKSLRAAIELLESNAGGHWKIEIKEQ